VLDARAATDAVLDQAELLDVVLSVAKDLIAACYGHEILRCAQDDTYSALAPDSLMIGSQSAWSSSISLRAASGEPGGSISNP